MRTRFAAWLVTGPLGHLWAGVADSAELLARWLRRRWLKRCGNPAAAVRRATDAGAGGRA